MFSLQECLFIDYFPQLKITEMKSAVYLEPVMLETKYFRPSVTNELHIFTVNFTFCFSVLE